MRDVLHPAQQITDTLLSRQSADIQNWTVLWDRFRVVHPLKMREHFETAPIPSMLDEFVSHKLTWRQEKIDTPAIGLEQTVNVCLRNQRQPFGPPRIALGLHHVSKRASFA